MVLLKSWKKRIYTKPMAPLEMKLSGTGVLSLVVLWEWKQEERGRREQVRSRNQHRGVQTERRRRFCWTCRCLTVVFTEGFRRMLQTAAGPCCSEQGIFSVPFTSAVHLKGDLLLPLLAPVRSCHTFLAPVPPPPSPRSVSHILSHTLSAFYLLHPLLSSLLKILWFCLMIDELHSIIYSWLLEIQSIFSF